MANLVAGKLEVTSNGKIFNVIGNFTINLGKPKREGQVGPDRVHGYSEMPQIPSISGEVRDSDSLDVTNDILLMNDATIVAKVANGKKYMIEEAWYSGDGNIETEEGKIQFECQGMRGQEV